VRNDARERQPGPHPVTAFLGVPGVDARDRNPNPHLARAGLRVGHLTDLKHLRSGSRPLVPSCEHQDTLRLSAKGAVDNDLAESALEESELLIVELGNEQLRDPASMDGRRLTETGDASLGERHHDAAGVGSRSVSTDEAFADQPCDPTAHARTRDERPVRKLCHAQLAVGYRQLSEDVEVSEGETSLSLQIHVQSAHERGVGSQQRGPGLQPTLARELILDEAVEELCRIGLGRSLHVHVYLVEYLQLQVYAVQQPAKGAAP
jgi:hypothetical protein